MPYLFDSVQNLVCFTGTKLYNFFSFQDYVTKTFPEPIDQWALGEAQKVMEKYAVKKKGVSVFPVEKIHQLLSKVM